MCDCFDDEASKAVDKAVDVIMSQNPTISDLFVELIVLKVLEKSGVWNPDNAIAINKRIHKRIAQNRNKGSSSQGGRSHLAPIHRGLKHKSKRSKPLPPGDDY